MAKKRVEKRRLRFDRNILMLGALCLVLFVCLVFVLIWNFSLRSEVRGLNDNIDILSVSAVNDFTLFVMSKVDRCEAVTLMGAGRSVVVNKEGCG